MKLNYVMPKNMAELEELGKSAFSKAGSYRNAMQVYLVGMAFMAHDSGNYDPVKRLIDTLAESNSPDHNKIVKWACKFIGLELIDATSTNKQGKEIKVKILGKWKGADYIRTNFQAAKETMFWSFSEPNIMQPYDVNDAVRAVLKTRAAKIKSLNGDKLTAEEKAAIKVEFNPEVIQALILAAGFEFGTDGNVVIHAVPGTTLAEVKKAA